MTDERYEDGDESPVRHPPGAPPPSATALDEETLERIAAYVDGRLQGAERDEVARLVRTDPDAYFVFAEAARFQADESESASHKPKVVAFRRFGQLGRLAAAASVLLAMTLAFLLLGGPPGVPLPLAELNERLEVESRSDDLLPALWTGPRVSSFAGALSPTKRAVWLGAITVDLGVAAEVRDRPAVRELSRRLLELVGTLPLRARIRDELERLADEGGSDAADSAGTREQITAIERELRRSAERDFFEGGRLVEAARLAARSENLELLLDSELRDGLAQLSTAELEPAVADRLDVVLGLIEDIDEKRPDFAALDTALQTLLLVLS